MLMQMMAKISARRSLPKKSPFSVIVSHWLPFETWLRLPLRLDSLSTKSFFFWGGAGGGADKADHVLLSHTMREWISFFQDALFIAPSCFTEPRRRSSRPRDGRGATVFQHAVFSVPTAAVAGSAARYGGPLNVFSQKMCVNTPPSRKQAAGFIPHGRNVTWGELCCEPFPKNTTEILLLFLPNTPDNILIFKSPLYC